VSLRLFAPFCWLGSASRLGLPCFLDSCRSGAGERVEWAAALKEGAKGFQRCLASLRPSWTRDSPSRFRVMLVIGTGLLVHTVYNLTRIDAGFDRSRLVTFSITLPMAEFRARGTARRHINASSTGFALYRAYWERLPCRVCRRIELQMRSLLLSRTTPSDDGKPFAIIDYYQFLMGDYFETMGIPIVAGHGFERTDIASQARWPS